MFFHGRVSDSMSLQVSKTLLSILTTLNNVGVWMVFIRPPTPKSSGPFNNPLVTVPKAPITIGIIVTFMFHSFFFNSLTSRGTYSSFHILSALSSGHLACFRKFFICVSSRISHAGFCIVLFEGIPIFLQTIFAPAYISSFHLVLLFVDI